MINNCICSFLKDKTRLLVTHAIQYASKADRIIYMKEGKIEWEGNYDELIKQEFYLNLNLHHHESNEEKHEIISDTVSTSTKDPSKIINENKEIKRITKDEDKEEGGLKGNVYMTYVRNNGGWCFLIFLVLFLLIWQTLKCSSDIWLAYWNKQISSTFSSFHFTIYAVLGLGSTIFIFFRLLLISYGSLGNSRRLHNDMVTHLIRAPINLYHDTVPKGQILNRLSKDMNNIDNFANLMFNNATTYGMNLIGEVVICGIFQPYCLILIPFILLFGNLVMNFYLNCSKELSRIEGMVRSPMLNCINETISGSITIRAFKTEKLFIDNFRKKVDEFLKVHFYLMEQ